MKLFSNNQSLSYTLFAILLGMLFMQSCSDNAIGFDFSHSPPPFNQSQAIRDTTLPGGTQIFVLKEGSGPFSVVSRDQIRVKFTARYGDGRIFDSSYLVKDDPSPTRTFTNLTPNAKSNSLGGSASALVEGLRKALIGMKEGEKSIIVVPPSMGYSNSNPGTNRFDLRGETLTYNIVLVDIRREFNQ